MALKIEQKGNGYYFRREDNNIIFSFFRDGYPNCCLLGILHSFGVYRDPSDEEFKEIGDYITGTMMPYIDVNQLLMADIQDGAGYILGEKMDNAMPINAAFNDNSGNFVYLFAIYK